jgi:transcriptional regulator with XRE-family HTH domain
LRIPEDERNVIVILMDSSLRIRVPLDLSQTVLAARRGAHLTQEELAVRAGVSQRWLSLFENGRTPGAELHRVLGVLAVLDVKMVVTLPSVDRGSDDGA